MTQTRSSHHTNFLYIGYLDYHNILFQLKLLNYMIINYIYSCY